MSLASVVQDIEAFAKGAVASFEGGVEKVAEQIGPVLVHDVENLLRELGQIAVSAVMTELPKAISGQEKFGSAVTNVMQTAEAQGKTVLIQDAQQAVQTAFRAVQVAVSTNGTA